MAAPKKTPSKRVTRSSQKAAEPIRPEEVENQSSPSGSKLAVRTKDAPSTRSVRHVNIEIPLPTSAKKNAKRNEEEDADSQHGHDEDVFKTPMERKHITFDDSDRDEFVTPSEAPVKNPLESSLSKASEAAAEDDDDEGEESDSDDDEAPEAISTQAAEVQLNKAAEAAAKAAEQQAAALKKRRQERDAVLKQQAAEAKKRSKKPEEEAEASGEAEESAPAATEKRKREVPKLLPLELLESDDEDDDIQRSDGTADGKPKRRKLGAAEQRAARLPKGPKDERVGSTVFRVMKSAGEQKLAPKSRAQTINLKETLLIRNRTAKPRGGFFVKNR